MFHWFIHDFENAFAGRAPGLKQLIELVQLPDRLIKISGRQQDRTEITQLHRTGENGTRSDKDRENDAKRADQIHLWIVSRPNFHYDQGGASKFIADSVESLMFLFFARKTANLPNAGKIIVQQRVHGGGSSAL